MLKITEKEMEKQLNKFGLEFEWKKKYSENSNNVDYILTHSRENAHVIVTLVDGPANYFAMMVTIPYDAADTKEKPWLYAIQDIVHDLRLDTVGSMIGTTEMTLVYKRVFISDTRKKQQEEAMI